MCSIEFNSLEHFSMGFLNFRTRFNKKSNEIRELLSMSMLFISNEL